jgi:hypothetical protein
MRLLTLAFIVGLIVFGSGPASARPACENVEALEQWSDNKADAGTDLLDGHQFSGAFRLLRDAADALYECGPAIVEAHVQSGVDAGNTDEDGLRKTWLDDNYSLAANDYDKAAQAAAALHRKTDCQEMIVRERSAYAKTDSRKSYGFSKDVAKCK